MSRVLICGLVVLGLVFLLWGCDPDESRETPTLQPSATPRSSPVPMPSPTARRSPTPRITPTTTAIWIPPGAVLLYQQFRGPENSLKELAITEGGEARLTNNGPLIGMQQLSSAETSQLLAEFASFCDLPGPTFRLGPRSPYEHRIVWGRDCPRTVFISDSTSLEKLPQELPIIVDLLRRLVTGIEATT